MAHPLRVRRSSSNDQNAEQAQQDVRYDANDSMSLLLPVHSQIAPAHQTYGISWQNNLTTPAPIIHAPSVPRDESPATTRTRSSSERSEATSSQIPFTFISENPRETNTRKHVTKIRQAVMKNYLLKNKGDPRRKRRRTPEPPAVTSSTSDPESSQTNKRRSIANRSVDLTPNRAVSSAAHQQRPHVGSSRSEGRLSRDRDLDYTTGIDLTSISATSFEPSFIEQRRNGFLAAPVVHTEFLDDNSLHRIDPVGDWSQYDWTGAGVQDLRYERRAQSPISGLHPVAATIGMQWPNAACSTSCISTAYDEIINRELGITVSGALDSTTVREKFLQLISESFRSAASTDGHMESTIHVTDDDLISNLHVMYSEIMSGGWPNAQIHRQGIERMVAFRGGFNVLAVQEESLARVIVVVFQFADCISESASVGMYAMRAEGWSTEPPEYLDTSLLEYPTYATGEFSATQALTRQDPVPLLLEWTRRATNAFLIYSAGRPNERSGGNPDAQVHEFARWAGAVIGCSNRIPNNHQNALTEATRLACCLFVHAMIHKVPLSRAARDFAQEICGASAYGTQAEVVIAYKRALAASSYESRWATKERVLVWCGLVILAATDGASSRSGKRKQPSKELEMARDFIAAVTLKVAMYQIFHDSVAMLGALKRFARIQRILSQTDARPDRQSLAPTSEDLVGRRLAPTPGTEPYDVA